MKRVLLAVLAVALLAGGAWAADFTVQLILPDEPLYVGGSIKVTISSDPEIFVHDHPFEWSCADTSIASQDFEFYNTCTIYGIKAGETTLKYKVHKLIEDKDGEGSCKIVVKNTPSNETPGSNKTPDNGNSPSSNPGSDKSSNNQTSGSGGGGGGCNAGLMGLFSLAALLAIRKYRR